MSFSITTLATEANYSYVNPKQVYDLLASKMLAQGWEYVEAVDQIVTTTTVRRHVWRAPSSITGLPEHFYIIFEIAFTTATGLYNVNAGFNAVKVFVAKDYDTGTKTASKMISKASATTAVLNADRTLPTSWVLTASLPTTAGAIPLQMGVFINSGSINVLIAMRPDHFIISNGQGSTNTFTTLYVGAIETLMSPTDDPMPVVMAQSMGGQSSQTTATTNVDTGSNLQQRVGWLTHPKLTPGQSYNYCHMGDFAQTHSSGAYTGNMAYNENVFAQGGLGSGTPPLFLGSKAIKVPISSCSGLQSANSRGGLRGYLKGMRQGLLQASAQGDLYSVEGTVYASLPAASASVNAVVDTTL